MRKEPYGVGSFVHVIKRGTRGSPIVRDNDDARRFLLMLVYFNDEFQPVNWYRDVESVKLPEFERPPAWPAQKRIVRIVSFCLLPNHFHLIVQEITEGGIAKFMQRIGTAMAAHFNKKYEESGSLFQGSYRSRTIQRDTHLRYVIAYVQLKNALDALGMHHNGNFASLYRCAASYSYASLGDHIGKFQRPIIDSNFLRELSPPREFREFSRDFLIGRLKVPASELQSAFFE